MRLKTRPMQTVLRRMAVHDNAMTSCIVLYLSYPWRGSILTCRRQTSCLTTTPRYSTRRLRLDTAVESVTPLLVSETPLRHQDICGRFLPPGPVPSASVARSRRLPRQPGPGGKREHSTASPALAPRPWCVFHHRIMIGARMEVSQSRGDIRCH